MAHGVEAPLGARAGFKFHASKLKLEHFIGHQHSDSEFRDHRPSKWARSLPTPTALTFLLSCFAEEAQGQGLARSFARAPS
eukprot:scaffold97997_cov34-Tisochrysis_lutea.AAC.3